MIYVKSLFSCVVLASVVFAQIPNFGRCPEYGKLVKKVNLINKNLDVLKLKDLSILILNEKFNVILILANSRE